MTSTNQEYFLSRRHVYGQTSLILPTATSGTVTQINTDSTLTGGPINESGTIGMPAVGVAGVYDYPHGITTDGQGRVSNVKTGLITGSDTPLKHISPSTTSTDLGIILKPWGTTRTGRLVVGGQPAPVNNAMARIVGTAADFSSTGSLELYDHLSNRPVYQLANFGNDNFSSTIGGYWNAFTWLSSVGQPGSIYQWYKINNQYRLTHFNLQERVWVSPQQLPTIKRLL